MDYNFDDSIDTTNTLNLGFAEDALIRNGAYYTSDNTILGNVASGSASFSIDVSPIVNTTYTATLTSENTCFNVGSVSINVSPNPKPVGVFNE